MCESSEMGQLNLSDLGRRARPPAITELMRAALETPGLLSLAAGFTDNRLLPVTEVAESVSALARIATEQPVGPEHLQYGTNAGRLGLRAVLAERVLWQDGSSRQAVVDSELSVNQVFITNGSQQALYLAIQTLCEPGDMVLVDRPSYFVFLELLAGLGVRAVSIPTQPNGDLDADKLTELLVDITNQGQRQLLKAVYFVSWFANPSGKTWSGNEKRILADILRNGDFVVPIIEDAAYRDLGFGVGDAAAQTSILGDAAWRDFPKLYTGTLTKPFSTGLKVGFGVCDHAAWRNAMLHVKGHQDFGTSNFNQALVEHALRSGDFERRLPQVREAYRAKRDILDASLREGGLTEAGWSWVIPGGGLYLWLIGPSNLDTRGHGALWRDALAEGVLYVPGNLCFGDTPEYNTLRLSYGVLGHSDLAEAGKRLSRALLRRI